MSYKENNFDAMHNDFRLYIEGVQVPFITASITQAYKEKPTATITIPPFPGLSDIGRNYQPKVHIFHNDYAFGVPKTARFSSVEERDAAVKNGYRLIFSGIITNNSESKSISAGSGSQSIQLTAEHHSTLLDQILFKYSNAAQESTERDLDGTNARGVAVMGQLSNTQAMTIALEGLEQNTPEWDKDTDKEKLANIRYDHGNFDRLKGVPSMMVVMWNMLKRDAHNKVLTKDAEALIDLYIPLVEDGIKFWDRLTGHDTIESGLNNQKVLDTDKNFLVDYGSTGKTMVPPKWKTFISDTAQIKSMQADLNTFSSSQGSSEVLSYGAHMAKMLHTLEYEMTTLSSPISHNDKITEYIVKPSVPNYYAPICNVLLPNLVTSISVNNGYRELPTRIICMQGNIMGASASPGGTTLNYTAPHSVRKARAGNDSSLVGSLSAFTNRVGKYEWGQGIKADPIQIPIMYSLLQSVMDKRSKENPDDKDSTDTNYKLGVDAWNAMYPGQDAFNPLKDDSGIKGFQKLPFLYADSIFASRTAVSRSASVNGVFNPYPIVGYPMDVVDPVPSRESYHGMCISITHNISAEGSSSTSYQLTAVSTFAELAKYNLPAANPYLMAVLGLTDDVRIYGNTKAYEKACDLYSEIMGIGAAEPAVLQDYLSGTIRDLKRTTGFWELSSEGEAQHESVLGSLQMVARNIQSLGEVEEDMYEDFISIEDWTEFLQEDPVVIDSHTRVPGLTLDNGKISTPGLDIESSPFLDYFDYG